MSRKERRTSGEASDPPNPRPNRPARTSTEKSLPKLSEASTSKMPGIRAQITDATTLAQQNIESAMERGEALSSMQDKASDLEAKTAVFQGVAEKTKRKIWWKDKKAIAVVFGITILILGAVVALIVVSTVGTTSGRF